MAGAGEAGTAAGLQLQRQYGEQDLLKMRADAEEALARTVSGLRTEERAAGIEQDIGAIPRRQAAELPGEVAKAKAVPQKLAAGESIIEGGKITVTAPSPKEISGFYGAYAKLMNARADEIASGVKDKGSFPHVIEKANPDGTTQLYDQNSGAIGTIIPGQAAKAAVSHWFSADEPAKAALPQVVQWTHGNRTLPGGLEDLYPAMKNRASGEGASVAGSAAAAPSLEAGAIVKGMRFKGGDPNNEKSWEPVAAKPAAAPTAVAPQGVVNKGVAEAASPAERLGQQVDKLKAALSEANNRLHSIGARQLKADPQAADKLRAEVKQLQDAYNNAQAEYEKQSGPSSAVSGRAMRP